MTSMRRFALRARFFLAALLIAGLTIVPAIDALACAFESITDTTSVAAEAGMQPAGGHHAMGLCEHSHCHHCSANVLPAVPAAPATAQPRQLPGERLPAWALSTRIDGLMRPPRI